MTRAVALTAALAVALVSATRAMPARQPLSPIVVHTLSLEVIGEGINTPLGVTPSTSTQFGYIAYLRGLPVFTGEPEDETTALFTFYLQAATLRVITDGPLRIITRVAAMTIYRDPDAGADFASPNTFRDGTPVLVAGLRQQVVVDTISGTFSAHNANTIIHTSPFSAGKHLFQLGEVDQTFQTHLSGHLNMPGPPSAYFAGYTSP
jgi:hypothetical protein